MNLRSTKWVSFINGMIGALFWIVGGAICGAVTLALRGRP